MTELSHGLLFIVSAPSGAGKTTLCKEIAKLFPNLAHSVSHTTRKPRPGETDGESYYFVDEDAFTKMADEGGFVEWARVHGNLYGTSKAEIARLTGLGKDVILDIDTQGAMSVKASGMHAVFVFVVAPSMEELEKRLRARESDSEEVIERRLKNAVDEMAKIREYDYLVVNDHFDEALVLLGSIIVAEKSRLVNMDEGLLKSKFGV